MVPECIRSGVAGANFAILITSILLLPRNSGSREEVNGSIANAQRGAPITLPELTEKFMASIRGKKSNRYVIDLDTKLKKAARAFSGQIRDIRADDIDAWLSGMTEASGRTKNNYRMALLTLFCYARDKKHLPRGEKTEAEFSTRYDDKGGNIGIYTPEQFRILLTNIDERFLPFIALGGFAGLRSIEILRLDWQDIWFDKGVIEVGKDKAKTATRRLPPILPALEAWLKPHAKSSGRVIPNVRDEFHFTRRFKAATNKLIGAEGRSLVRMVHNGLRHSFCSYRLAVTKSSAEPRQFLRGSGFDFLFDLQPADRDGWGAVEGGNASVMPA